MNSQLWRLGVDEWIPFCQGMRWRNIVREGEKKEGLIILYPSFLEDPGFENGGKFLVTMIVPMFSVTLYLLLYMRGIMIGTYYMLRGTLDTQQFRVLALLRLSFKMMTFVVRAKI